MKITHSSKYFQEYQFDNERTTYPGVRWNFCVIICDISNYEHWHHFIRRRRTRKRYLTFLTASYKLDHMEAIKNRSNTRVLILVIAYVKKMHIGSRSVTITLARSRGIRIPVNWSKLMMNNSIVDLSLKITSARRRRRRTVSPWCWWTEGKRMKRKTIRKRRNKSGIVGQNKGTTVGTAYTRN